MAGDWCVMLLSECGEFKPDLFIIHIATLISHLPTMKNLLFYFYNVTF